MQLRYAIAFAALLTSLACQGATSRDLIKSTQSWNGEQLPAQTLQQPEVTIKEIIIAPGERLPLHIHPVINAGILASGELTVHSGSLTRQMVAGDPLIELVNTEHYGQNNGDEPAKIIVFYVAEKGAQLTVVSP
ncbi:cupin domain-containing protein [Shewanella sp. Scap07]|uniref:cupin domain-containing protein n=1 Tax=Shewanella sp. Scap07 TaxID=2589987 RepID=UPI0015BD605A|nr:cupin domain-containing protein [Shewanella sp. Scap07]QLE86282.1 cupin domain-containing protein [Shewanella sp. Scap07]